MSNLENFVGKDLQKKNAKQDHIKKTKQNLTAENLTKLGWNEEERKGFRIGKQRVVSKNKNKTTKLKQIILEERQQANTPEATNPPATSSNDDPENKNQTPEKLDVNRHVATGTRRAKKSQNKLEVRDYVRQMLSEELDNNVKQFLEDLTRFQERLKEKDPLKFKRHKRYVVGIREAERALKRGKLIMLILAPNIEKCSADKGLDDIVQDLTELAIANEVPVVYALSRNRLGKALGKNMRQSLVGVLNVEGAHALFKQIVNTASQMQEEWVIKQLGAFSNAMNLQDPPDGGEPLSEEPSPSPADED